MTFDDEVLYSTIVEEALSVLGLRIDYWEAEEIADNTLRKLEGITLLHARRNPTQSSTDSCGSFPSD